MEYWLDFELLKHAKGKAYAIQRNRILQSNSGLESRLTPYIKSDDWITAATATILMGWIRNQEAFGTALKNLSDEDLTKAQQSVIGIDVVYKKYRQFAYQYSSALVPLAWEFLLKQEGEVEDWKLIAMTHVIAAAPHPLSIKILIHFIETTPNEDLSNVAASSLAQLINEDNIEKVKRAKARHQIISDEFDFALEDAATEEEEEDEEDEEDEEENMGKKD